jgi:hypothetical protein
MIVYSGSDRAATEFLYADLSSKGPAGVIALNLLRAQKCSSRAKVYRGGIPGKGSYKQMAYDRKQWSIDNLCIELAANAEPFGIKWGWKIDPEVVFGESPSYVLYVDIPPGQVSFHSPSRGDGPDYPGEFCGEHKSEIRIIRFAESILGLTK